MSLSKSEKVINEETSKSQKQNSTSFSKQKPNKVQVKPIGQGLFAKIIMSTLAIIFVYLLQLFYFEPVSSYSSSDSSIPKPSIGYESVTYNSLIKLTHSETQYRLHSQEAKYGTGSGQQVVSGLIDVDHVESYWLVYTTIKDTMLPAGTPIKCGDTISLKHTATDAFLHSHLFQSPLSQNQEVSGFNGHDSGDSWKVICTGDEKDTWKREKNIKLQHVDTKHYLSASKKNVFPQPISGQLEVFGTSSENKNNLWSAQEGIYFPHIGLTS